jgi:hypothetical protein
MHIKEYVESEKSSLDKFQKYWEEMNKETPRHFPMDMPTGEWFEQFTAWQETE